MADILDMPIPVAHDTTTVVKPRYATIADLKRKDVDFLIQTEDEDGQPLEFLFPVRTLSFFRVQEIRASVVDPVAPLGEYFKDESGAVNPVRSIIDPTYLNEKSMKENERIHRLVLASIRQDVLAIPGANDDEKLAWLRENFDSALIMAVYIQLNQMAVKTRVSIETRAENFQ